MKKASMIFAACVAVTSSTALSAPIALCRTSENIVADRIFGTWVLDTEVEQRLGLKGPFSDSVHEIHYTQDDSAVQYFTHDFLAGKCAYAAGILSTLIEDKGAMRTWSSPFVLVTHFGNPAIFFDEDGLDDCTVNVTDLHLGYTMMAKGETPSNDILFVGGDHNNQRLYALKRK